MSRTLIYPWNMASSSSKQLAHAIGVKRVFPDGKYSPQDGDTVINWGASTPPKWQQGLESVGKFINHPDSVAKAINKVYAFKTMVNAGVRTPEFTTQYEVAQQWVDDEDLVVCRTKVKGHSAEGIVLFSAEHNFGEQLPLAPLYTKYRKKAEEYRVHVVNGDVIDVSQKRLRTGLPNKPDYRVRNHGGGWVYARIGIVVPVDVYNQARGAISALGLEFGAVDLGWNNHYKQATVYEVNSAPGLTGTTLYRYAQAFAELTDRPLLIKAPPIADDDMAGFDINEFILDEQ